MALPDISHQNILDALQKFDTEYRNTEAWRGWENKQKWQYAILENDQYYPIKQVIHLATGRPVNTFSGGEESIKFVKNRGFHVEALRPPTETDTIIALYELLIERYPETIETSEAIKVLAEQFLLTSSLLRETVPSGEPHWDNRVRQARRKLVDAGVLDEPQRGEWRLRLRDEPKYWVEKTLVQGRPDRESGDHALGSALWSPKRASDDRDIYRLMRFVQPGDHVLHLTDNEAITRISQVTALPETDFVGLQGSEWEGRPAYRVQLDGGQALSPPLHRSMFFDDTDVASELKGLAGRQRGLFFTSTLELNQGAYLTEAPAELLQILQKAYRKHAGKTLGFPWQTPQGQNVQPRLRIDRLEAAWRIFTWIFGENPFDTEAYLADERRYKLRLSEQWRDLVTQKRLQEALNGADPQKYAGEIGRFVTQSPDNNLLPWRYAVAIKAPFSEDSGRIFLEAISDLLFGDHDTPDIDAFNTKMADIYDQALDQSAVRAASVCIPTLFLWLHRPQSEIFIRPSLYQDTAEALLYNPNQITGQYLTITDYQNARLFATSILDHLADRGCRDFIDVQGFLWVLGGDPYFWFGGHNYGSTDNKLEKFDAKSVYAIGFGRDNEALSREIIREIRDGTSAKDIKRHIDQSDLDRNAQKNLKEFVDLCRSVYPVLFAKSVYYHKSDKVSLIRINAVANIKGQPSYDPGLGWQVGAAWLSRPDEAFELGSYYGKLNGTLLRLKLKDTLEALAKPYVAGKKLDEQDEKTVDSGDEGDVGDPIETSPHPEYSLQEFCSETGFEVDRVEGWLRRLERKGQIILQGPPGTGKTYLAERLARYLVGGTYGDWDLVQFHPSYAYEDFMQGIRPYSDGGQLQFDVQPGRFLEFCQRAGKDKSSPFVLIIDEINRANLSRVFGELMYLLEYRDREIPLATSKERFRLPSNVRLIGTMNTADRSIALVDHALRRRFSFIHLAPEYPILERHLAREGFPDAKLVEYLRNINREINDRHYEIGISYFLVSGDQLQEQIEDIWRGEIEPYLEEYFYDQPDRVEAFRWDRVSDSILQPATE